MQETSKVAAAAIINSRQPQSILDAPSGTGWLPLKLDYDAEVDGIDLYADSGDGYRTVLKRNLDIGLGQDLPDYDCVACFEGIEHLGNPALFIKSSFERLRPGGFIIVTTPNVWYPASKLQYLVRGFFPGFPAISGKVRLGSHMHITPWSYPQLHLFLELGGFKNMALHEEPLSRPKHLFERLVGWPQKIYCKGKLRRATTEEERSYWRNSMTTGSVLGRHLIVTAEKPGPGHKGSEER